MSLFNIEKNFIFIHIPKTGGTSMEAIGWLGEGYNKHYDIDYFRRTYGNLDDVFKFAFVRDPYTRFASGVLGHAVASNKMDLLLGTMSVDEVRKIDRERFMAFTLTNRGNFDKIVAIKPQYSFITINDVMVMDFLGRFEHLQEDFDTLCEKLGFERTILPHLVKGRYTDYDWLYTPETREIVKDYYWKDFDLYNWRKTK